MSSELNNCTNPWCHYHDENNTCFVVDLPPTCKLREAWNRRAAQGEALPPFEEAYKELKAGDKMHWLDRDPMNVYACLQGFYEILAARLDTTPKADVVGETSIECPHCPRWVKRYWNVCPYCSGKLDALDTTQPTPPIYKTKREKMEERCKGCLHLFKTVPGNRGRCLVCTRRWPDEYKAQPTKGEKSA